MKIKMFISVLKWKRNECNMKIALQQQFMTHKMLLFCCLQFFGEFKGKKEAWMSIVIIHRPLLMYYICSAGF